MRLYCFSNGRVTFDKGIVTPGRDAGRKIAAPIPFFLLRHPGGNVLIDTGAHPDAIENPDERWGGLAKVFRPEARSGEGVVEQLGGLGLQPDDIHLVINTHLHMDHAGGNQFFPNAAFLVQKREWETAQDPWNEGKGYFTSDWDHPLKYEMLEGSRDVFGDGRLVVLPSPGHTPGLMICVVRLARTGLVVLAGDTVYMRENLDHNLVPKTTWNPEALTKSMETIRRFIRDGALVIFGHDPEQWASLQTAPAFYD